MRFPLFIALALCARIAAAAGCDGERPLIAIDVGHDRERFGATSARGEPEWRFNLALAQHLAARLPEAGIDAKVLNPDGERLALAARGARAAALGAQLLLSVHHDSAKERQLSSWEYEGRSLRYTEFAGHSLFVSARSGRFSESRAFAQQLGEALLRQELRPTLHHADYRPLMDGRLGLYQFDDLIVLHSSPIPAVLLEGGVILNRDEELRVQTPEHRDRIARAVVEAVQAWCRPEPPLMAAGGGEPAAGERPF